MPIYKIIQSFRSNHLNEITKILVEKKITFVPFYPVLLFILAYFGHGILIRRLHRIFYYKR